MWNYQSTLFASEAAHRGNKGIIVNDQFSGSDAEESSGSEAATAYYSCPAGVESDDDEDVVKQYTSRSFPATTTWEESYSVFHKYDEEMLLLDRLSFQKLQETESLEWIETCPRSKSEREPNSEKHSLIRNKKLPWECPNNLYHELEAAYVAQICLTWEALKWNYNYFLSTLITSSSCESESDRGCPATTAQQFQQFQVLLQRYIENEAYENGRRPEIYARMRSLAPMLLQVPHCISDKKDKQCRIITALLRKTRRASADHTLLQLLKKVNKKKKSKLKEIRISGKKSLTRRWVREEEEMERLMAHIDLKVVSRVLKMAQVNDKQLHWCEEKMSRVKFCDGKLLRDQFLLCPLFYPLS
ncbi:unnamed protein product [Cuscuta campestris]|uniref:Uncharacterized protein n=1 Tax=Cuscuta campestris TaxID=132261 RepID=A0A484MEK7_9ASTE|nr:unnamed protein product [Cuscuta campestris]